MKSIRNQLLFFLLLGLAVLLVSFGTVHFLSFKNLRLEEVDDDLRQAGKLLHNRLFADEETEARRKPRPRNDPRADEYDSADGIYFYQVRNAEGEVTKRSVSLGERTIERPASAVNRRSGPTVAMADGTRVRIRVDDFDPAKKPQGKGGGRARRVEIIVARDLSETDRALRRLLSIIWAVGLGAAAVTAGLITMILSRGLAPLRKLGSDAAHIDANSLGERFDVDNMPAELEPIRDRLNDLLSRLENSFERERRFSSDLAHELRTPLAELSALAELAQRIPDKVPKDWPDQIVESVGGMQGIVSGLLTLARWEQDSTELELETFRMEEIVLQCWKPFAEKAEERSLPVSIDIDPEAELETDPRLFRHILNNLFSNAVEYTSAKGLISVASESGVIISVTNSVENLAPSELPNLFDRFWRGDRSRTGSGHAGLGLSLAKACAELLSFDLTASLDGGSRLRFVLKELT